MLCRILGVMGSLDVATSNNQKRVHSFIHSYKMLLQHLANLKGFYSATAPDRMGKSVILMMIKSNS